jgi:peptidoglycan/LPS O-acetylase OafA/YrhL
VTIAPELTERLEAALRRRAESWAASYARLREIFGDDVPSRARSLATRSLMRWSGSFGLTVIISWVFYVLIEHRFARRRKSSHSFSENGLASCVKAKAWN